MIIKLSPQNRPNSVVFEKRGESIIVDGEEFDFSRIQEGDVLPRDAIKSEWFGHPGDVTRVDGEIVLTIVSPFGPGYNYEQYAVRMLGDGLVPLPEPEYEEDLPPPCGDADAAENSLEDDSNE